MDYFTKLGQEIDASWRRAHYATSALPRVAGDIVLRAETHKHVDPSEVLHWVRRTPTLPAQRDIEAQFGSPPITVYRNEHFTIDVLFWADGNTAIHDHAFWGVWQVFAGSSLHCGYDFAADQQYGDRLATGRLTLKGAEILRAGDVRAIPAGSQLIHALFHLDRPSVSLLVRTDALGDYQRSYAAPGVAFSADWRPPKLVRTLQCMSFMKATRTGDFLSFAIEAIRDVDAYEMHWILRQAVDLLENDFERVRALFTQAREIHGPLVDLLSDTFWMRRRTTALLKLRRPLVNPEHRFFLGLLLNVHVHGAILSLVKARHPGRSAEDLLVQWVEDLWGTADEVARAPLRLPPITKPCLSVLRGLMAGDDVDTIQRGLPAGTVGAADLCTQLRASALGALIPPGRVGTAPVGTS